MRRCSVLSGMVRDVGRAGPRGRRRGCEGAKVATGSSRGVAAMAWIVSSPGSAAAFVAMLSTRRPQQLLVAYVLAGAVFSVAIGTVVVVLLKGFAPGRSPWPGHPLVGTALGALALGYAGAVWIGWLPRSGEEAPT